jgi:hypothetical protein
MKITVAGTGYVGLSNAMLLTFIKKTMVLQMVADQWIATSLPLLAMTAGIRHCERSAAIHAPSRHCERSVAIHAPGTVIASAARQSMSPAPSLRAQRGNPCPQHRHCERSAETHAPGIVIASEARQSMSCVPIIRIDPRCSRPTERNPAG